VGADVSPDASGPGAVPPPQLTTTKAASMHARARPNER